jgi:hypothetical protein
MRELWSLATLLLGRMCVTPAAGIFLILSAGMSAG